MADRPALVRIEQKADELEAHVYITLAWNDREYLGQATGAHRTSRLVLAC